MNYGDMKMKAVVKRPNGSSIPKDIMEHITWIPKNIEKVVKAAECDHIFEPGDSITITIRQCKEGD